MKLDARLSTFEELMERLESINRQIDKAESKKPSPYPDVWEKQHKAIARLTQRKEAIEQRMKR
jgi:hypothetical protein